MFNDTKLNQIYEETSTERLEYRKNLDAISSDIKKLESILQRSAIGYHEMEIGEEKFIIFAENRLRYSEPLNGNSALRPLIECKAHIRMQVYQELYKFFESCMNLIKIKNQPMVKMTL